jgi:DNA-binding NtrC family response regulator
MVDSDSTRTRRRPATTAASTIDRDGGVRPGRLRVLLVDDDPAVLASIAEWLAVACGAEVTAVGSAEEAMVATQPDSFDVCILDYRLGGANGLTLGAMLREINPAARLILLSGQLSAGLEVLALEHGFGRVFAKPVAPEVLAEAITH